MFSSRAWIGKTNSIQKILRGSTIMGSFSGLLATIPMTITMELWFRSLPKEEQYPLQPRLISDRMISMANLDHAFDERRRLMFTYISHFLYGAAIGAIVIPLASEFFIHPILQGFGLGVSIWALGYLGWLPAFGILKSAVRYSPRRTMLNIASHVVWGSAGCRFYRMIIRS